MDKKSTTPRGFLDLPYELRLEVYSYCSCIPHKREIQTWYSRLVLRSAETDPITSSCDFLSLISTSKQISEEVLDIFYGDNTVRIHMNLHGEKAFEFNISEKNRKSIRYLHLFIDLNSVVAGNTREPDSPLWAWASMIPRLKRLRLVTWHIYAIHYKAPTGFEMFIWLRWLEPYFKLLAKLLEGTQVDLEVDDEGVKETRELADKYLPAHRRITPRISSDFFIEGEIEDIVTH